MSKWDQNIHEQSDKILIPPKPLRPHIVNWPQNPKITPNMVLETRKRKTGLSNRYPVQMIHTQCGVQYRGKTEMKTRSGSRIHQNKVSQQPR